MANSDDGKKKKNDPNQLDGDDDEKEIEFNQEEQIIDYILGLGNEIWKNFGGEPLDDVGVFFQHQFYIKCFEMAYPDFDFSGLLEGEDEDEVDQEKMAEAIQALIDLLSQEILMQDMSHIRGDEIVNGNPEHCINLLQILQQISLMQEDSEKQTGRKNNNKSSSPESALKHKRDGSEQKSSPGKKGHSNRSDEKEKQNQNLIMGLDGEDEDFDNSASPNKQQFLDNFEDDDENDDNQRVGDVIGNIGEELDIEFDNEIQTNLQNNRKGEVQMNQDDEDDDQEHQIIDHNDVEIIDDGADFEGDHSDDYQEDDDDDDRQLNRKTDNMAEYNREKQLENPNNNNDDEMDEDDDGDMDPHGYGEELGDQNSSRFQINNQDEDEEGLNQLHDQLKILDNGQAEERHIIDDRNLQMEINTDDNQDDEDEGQHYPDDQEDEDMMQLEEMEAQMQHQQLMDLQNQDFDDIDPEVLDAAQKMGLDDEGIRALQQQLQQQQQYEDEDGDEGEDGQLDDEHLQDMLNEQDGEEHQVVSSEGHQIVGGGRNITDGDGDNGEEMDSEMAQQLKQLNDVENEGDDDDMGEDQEDDDDNQLIDIDKLNDEEKAILIQYLQSEYQKNPDQLPLPKDVIEQFLEDNRGLVENLQEMQENGEGDLDDGEDQDDKYEEDHYDERNDHVKQQEGQMVIQEDQQQELDEDEEIQNEEDQQFQGEDLDQNDQMNQEPGVAEFDEEYGDEDNQDQQIINPQYQLEDMVVRDQDGNLIQHNLNVNTQKAQLSEQQQYQMMILAQQQMAQQQQQQMMMQQQVSRGSKVTKKKRGSMAHKKPPLAGGLPMTGAGSMNPVKSKRKPYMKNINTISHEDENNNPNLINFNMVSQENHFGRKNHSQKRPQTAKSKKPFGTLGGGKPKSRVNNFMVSSTPSHKIKGAKQMGNTHGLVVPQSQMFTSFGAPANKVSIQSQRKSFKKKTNQPIVTSSISNVSKKRLRGSIQGIPKPKSKTKQLNQQNFQIAPNQNQMALQQQMLMQQQMLQNQISNGGLVDMPILSEEFLNQLNEDQLLALLAQQQQLMMLRQQQQIPGDGGDHQQQPQTNLEELPEGSNEQGTEEENEEISNMVEGQVDLSQQQMQQMEMQPQGVMDQQEVANQQALMMHYQQQLQQQQPMVEEQSTGPKQSLRNRGRSKAYAQSGRQVGSATRIPGMVTGSASRSHGSRKRGQKTRSSLNVKSSLPLNSIGYLGPVPQSLSVLPSSVNVKSSKKAAAQIYGNASVLQNLTSQRKKSNSASQTKKATKGKRSQPNQGGKFNKMQQQIQAQNLHYNMMNDQQLQQNMMLQQQQMQLQALQNQQQSQNYMGQNEPVNMSNEHHDGVNSEIQNENQEENSEAIINEASPEQEDGESNAQQFQNQVMQDNQNDQEASNIQAPNQISNIAEDLSTEQIIELLQNAQNQQSLAEEGQQLIDENGNPVQPLPEEVYLQLQQVLQDRMIQQQQQQQFLLQQQQMANIQGLPLAKQEKYDGFNICNILTESVSKAKNDLAHLAPGSMSGKKSQSGSPVRNNAAFAMAEQKDYKADDRITKQKKQFANLLKEYKFEQKIAEQKRMKSAQIQQKGQRRDDRIKAIKQRKFEEEMINQQRSQMFKRNAQQVRLCKKVYKLASDLEKNKLLEEKKQFKENEIKKIDQKHKMVETIENYYKDKIAMLKEKIHSEKFERHVAEEAQKKALCQMKKELDQQKNQELQRYINLLHQEDEKFNMQNLQLGKLEKEIIKMYKKK